MNKRRLSRLSFLWDLVPRHHAYYPPLDAHCTTDGSLPTVAVCELSNSPGMVFQLVLDRIGLGMGIIWPFVRHPRWAAWGLITPDIQPDSPALILNEIRVRKTNQHGFPLLINLWLNPDIQPDSPAIILNEHYMRIRIRKNKPTWSRVRKTNWHGFPLFEAFQVGLLSPSQDKVLRNLESQSMKIEGGLGAVNLAINLWHPNPQTKNTSKSHQNKSQGLRHVCGKGEWRSSWAETGCVFHAGKH